MTNPEESSPLLSQIDGDGKVAPVPSEPPSAAVPPPDDRSSLGLSGKMTCRVLFRWPLGRLRKILFPLRASMELGNTLTSVVHVFFYLVALWIYWNSRHNSSNFSSSSSLVQEQQ